VVDGQLAVEQFAERFAPHVEHRVGAEQRVAHRGRLLEVQPFSLVAIGSVGEVEVARHPE
jgi:hypothetical protein